MTGSIWSRRLIANRRTGAISWRWLGVFALLAGLLLAWRFFLQHGALDAGERLLRRHNVTWEDKIVSWSGCEWMDLQSDWGTIGSVSVALSPSPLNPAVRVDITDADVDVSRLQASEWAKRTGLQLQSNRIWQRWVPVEVYVQGVSLRWKDELFVQGAGGTLVPEVDLVVTPNDGDAGEIDGAWIKAGRVTRDRGRVHLEIHQSMAWQRGKLSVTGMPEIWVVPRNEPGSGPTWRVEFRSQIEVAHPMLAPGPLAPFVWAWEGDFSKEEGRFSISGDIGDVPFSARGTLPGRTDAPLNSWRADVRLDEAPLRAFVALLAPWVPEATKGDLSGTVGLNASLSGPQLSWTLEPKVEDLQVSGVLPAVEALRSRNVTWRVPDQEGGWMVRQAAPGLPGWTPLSSADRVVKAIIASEDAHFFDHPGFDLASIQRVLDEAADSGASVTSLRGASTVTQQLVKNLFLDGERTLARKCRELLMAVEMETVLHKRDIIELYVNVVEFGPQIYGVGPASEAFFLKSPARLTLRESAYLAAVLPAPRTWYRTAYLKGKTPTRLVDSVVASMVHTGAIDASEAERGRRQPVLFVPPE